MASLKNIEDNIGLLKELESNPEISQQKLSKKLNISVGLINLFIKRLTKKGVLKIKRINGKSLAYLLTAKGIKEKTRLTKEYVQSSVSHYKKARFILKNEFIKLNKNKIKKIVIFATREWAEISYITAKELGIRIKGFIIENEQLSEKDKIFDIPVFPKDYIEKTNDPVIGLGILKNKSNSKINHIFETEFKGIS